MGAVNMSETLFADIETDGLLYDVTKIHCIVVIPGDTNRHEVYVDDLKVPLPPGVSHTRGNIRQGLKRLQQAKRVVMHNGAQYDYNVIRKLYPMRGCPGKSLMPDLGKLFDTMLGSYMRYPERRSHSIQSYGAEEDGHAKVENEDWSTLSTNMIHRCIQDTRETRRIYRKLLSDGLSHDRWSSPMNTEVCVANIHGQQTLRGVGFDLELACDTVNELDDILRTLEASIRSNAPFRVERPYDKPVDKPFKIDGNLSVVARDWIIKDLLQPDRSIDPKKAGIARTRLATVKGPFSRIEIKPINLDSAPQVQELLLSLGWKPTEWNFVYRDGRRVKTSPKLTEDSYSSLPDGLGQDIARYNTLKHRRRFLLNEKNPEKGAINTIRTDSRVAADALTCATPTSRYRHMGTVCNIPKVKVPYGKVIRSLFCTPEGKMHGFDLSGIEARALAHYIMRYPGGPELAAIITDGDFHEHNADFWGVDRDLHAKGGLYALMYGCYPNKLAETLGKPKSEGQRLFDLFWENNKPIKLLIDDLERSYAKRGFIYGIDGRPLYVREERKLLNTLLQNAATMVFKRWMVHNDNWLMANNLSGLFFQTIAYHDELQYESRFLITSIEDKTIKAILNNALLAGEDLGFKVPTPADPKVGKNWADTH